MKILMIVCCLLGLTVLAANSQDQRCAQAAQKRPLFGIDDFTTWIKVRYTIWIQKGVNPATFAKTIEVIVPFGTTFYQVMQVAQNKDADFAFQTVVVPVLGHKVTSIHGVSEDPANLKFWQLFRTTPDPAHPPGNALKVATGIDKTIPKHNEHYLFWHHFVAIP